MDRSDFGVVKGDADIRGWDVRNSSGRKIGEVEDLIVDAQERKVRYMIVDMKSNELDLRKHRVLIPIGLASLDQEEDDVLLHSVSLEQLRHLPTYDLNILDDITEKMICVALGRDNNQQQQDSQQHALQSHTSVGSPTTGSATQNDDFYRHDFYNEDNLYKQRMQKAQEAGAGKNSGNNRSMHLQNRESNDSSNNRARQHEMNEERRMEMVRNRRQMYEDRRSERPGERDNRNSDDNSRDRNDRM